MKRRRHLGRRDGLPELHPIDYHYRLHHVVSTTPEGVTSHSDNRKAGMRAAWPHEAASAGPVCGVRTGAPGIDDGAWPSGKARDFGPRIRRFESFRPSHFLEASW